MACHQLRFYIVGSTKCPREGQRHTDSDRQTDRKRACVQVHNRLAGQSQRKTWCWSESEEDVVLVRVWGRRGAGQSLRKTWCWWGRRDAGQSQRKTWCWSESEEDVVLVRVRGRRGAGEEDVMLVRARTRHDRQRNCRLVTTPAPPPPPPFSPPLPMSNPGDVLSPASPPSLPPHLSPCLCAARVTIHARPMLHLPEEAGGVVNRGPRPADDDIWLCVRRPTFPWPLRHRAGRRGIVRSLQAMRFHPAFNFRVFLCPSA